MPPKASTSSASASTSTGSSSSTRLKTFSTVRPPHNKYETANYLRPALEEYSQFVGTTITLLKKLHNWTNLVLYLPWDKDIGYLLEKYPEAKIIELLHRDITGVGWYLLKRNYDNRYESDPLSEPLPSDIISRPLNYSIDANGGYTLMIWDKVNKCWIQYDGISAEGGHRTAPQGREDLVKELKRIGVPSSVASTVVGTKKNYGVTARTLDHLDRVHRAKDPSTRLYIALRNDCRIEYVFHSTLADPGTPMDPRTTREQRGSTGIGEFIRIINSRCHDNRSAVTWLNNFAHKFEIEVKFPYPYENLRYPTQHQIGLEEGGFSSEESVEIYLTSGQAMRLHAPTPATNGRFYLQLGENCTIYTARLNLPLGLKGKTSADAEVLVSVTFVESDVDNAIQRARAVDPNTVVVCKGPVLPPAPGEDPVWLMLLSEDDNGRLYFATMSSEYDYGALSTLSWPHLRLYLFGKFREAAWKVSVAMAQNRALLEEEN